MVCKQSGLELHDLEIMTIGMCLDYVDDYVEMNDPKKQKARTRRAQQTDFDSF